MRMQNILFRILTTALALAGSLQIAVAAEWSSTEVQFQYGDLKKAFQGGGNAADTGGTSILTFQHASGWKYGDNFFFFDYLNYGQTDVEAAAQAPGDDELYGEWYSNFSLGKISGKDLKVGFIRDFGFIAGFNFTAEIDTTYYLPGIRFSLDLPGFAFANLDFTAYIQGGANKFGVKEDDSFMVDFSWALPFTIGSTKWSLEGHVEYIDGASQSIGGAPAGKRESWILAQPQLRLDVGDFWDSPDTLFAGLEYQYWHNKLGDPDTTDNVAQLLLVWRF